MSHSETLHGIAPDKSDVVLILIDVINDFEFADGEKLFKKCSADGKENCRVKEKGERGETSRR